MTIQAQIKPKPICNLLAFLTQADPQYAPILQVSAEDLGYEISEEQLASEMRAHNTGEPVDQAILEVRPDEFEPVYRWFLS